MQPVYLCGAAEAETDDRIAYWFMTNRFIGAVAGQWSSYVLRCSRGLAVIDGLVISNGNAAVQFLQCGLGSRGAGWPVSEVSATISNQFGTRSRSTAPSPLPPVVSDIRNNAAAAIAPVAIQLPLGANGTGRPCYSWREGTLPSYVLTPPLNGGSEYALIVEPTTVNQSLSLSAWGRWFPEAPGPA